jgi:hypothetical protein
MDISTVISGTLLTASILCSAADVIPGKIFEADFESSDGTAKFAGGKAAPTARYVTADAEGVHGKAYRLTKEGKKLLYFLGGNAEVQQGTVNIWVNTVNYDTVKTQNGGWSVLPVNLFTLRFTEGKNKWATASCYIYRGADARGVRFAFDAGTPPFRFGSHATTAAELKLLKQNTWHLVTCTWDAEHIGIWIDGKYQARSLRSGKIGYIQSLKVDRNSKNSTILIRNGTKEQSVAQRDEITDVDDFTIYDRVLSPAEIRQLYVTGKNIPQNDTDLPVTSFQGSFRNGKEYVRCDLDLTVLRRMLRDFADDCTLSCRIVDSKGGTKFTDSLKIGKKARPELLFSGLAAADRYTARFELTAANGKKLSFERSFDKPDTSWCESTAGMEDTTPEPWTRPVLGKDDSVSVWNRVYTFKGGPFPENVTANGKKMLVKAPHLILNTEKGERIPTGKITRRTQGGSFVRFNGEMSTPDGFAADFETTVEFDGFVQVDFKLKRPYPVKSMQVRWQVEKEFGEHFMTPKVNSDKNPVFSCRYNGVKCLYFASEKGGFAFGKTGDANWVYDPSETAFVINKKTRETTLRVISRPVDIPKDADYRFCFIATPTRPLMKNSRAWRYCDSATTPESVILLYHMYQNDGNLLISPEKVRKAAKGKRRIHPYSASSFLVACNLEARWFFDEWLMYSYQYGMGKGIAIPSCLNTSKANFLAENTRKSLSIPEFEFIDGYYFDCCGVYSCSNHLHGCGFTDKFGRKGKTVTLLALRSYLKRIVRLLHSRGRTLGAHGQYSFNPCAHSLCDYWLTGEEMRGMAMKEGAQVYCDPAKVTDLHLRTNSNWRVLSNVVMCMLYYGKGKESRIPAMTRLLLEDQKVFGFHSSETQKLMNIVWKVFGKFKVDEGTVRRHFEQHEIVTDHPELKVTYYRVPGNGIVAIIGNLSRETVKGNVDFSKVKKGGFTAKDEIAGAERTASDGKIPVELSPMNFTILRVQ